VASNDFNGADALMKPVSRPINVRGLLRGGNVQREGRRMKQIRRQLIIGGGVATTRELVEAVYAKRQSWPEWCWRRVRWSAKRYADPVLNPRSRPLLWKAKKPIT
jgi:hypothetical protein